MNLKFNMLLHYVQFHFPLRGYCWKLSFIFVAQKFQRLSNINEIFVYGKSYLFPMNVFLRKSYKVLLNLNAPFAYDQEHCLLNWICFRISYKCSLFSWYGRGQEVWPPSCLSEEKFRPNLSLNMKIWMKHLPSSKSQRTNLNLSKYNFAMN